MSAPRTPNPPPDPKLRRRRSVDMYDRMEERDWEEDMITRGGERFLEIDKTYYRILDSGVTEFDNENKPLVSVGAYLSRELIILDPSSKYLQHIYQKLKHEIQDLQKKDQNIQTILDHTINFVRDYLKPDPGKLKAKVEAILSDPNNYMRSYDGDPLEYRGNPVIALDTFIEEGIGVCRHHALFLAYLVHNLILDRLLPEGNVFSHRDTVKSGGAHVWTIYKPIQNVDDNDEYDYYLADSLWYDEAFNLQRYADFFKEWGYGEPAIEYCVSHYNRPDIETVAYTKINSHRVKEDLIYDLLNAPTEMRRKYLNLQHRLGASELIKADLKSSPEYRRHRHYHDLLDDIERVQDQSLHKKYYADIKDDDDKQQFVLGLLCKSERDRDLVLDKQDLQDLRKLKKSLLTSSADQEYLFQQFDTYKKLLSEIENRIEIKLLHEMHYDKIPESADRERFMSALLLLKPDARSLILDKQDLADLNHMKIALDAKHAFYRNFDASYRIVLEDIERRIELIKLHDQQYDRIQSPTMRRTFVSQLLLCELEQRNAILDKQDRADLQHLHTTLTRSDEYHDYDAYQAAVKDISERITLKDLLYNNSYDAIDTHNKRRKFVIELLLVHSEEERSTILDRQDTADLKHLQKSLMYYDEYQAYDAYHSVKKEIDKRLSLELLKLIKTIITSGQLEVKNPSWTPKMWFAPGKKLEIDPGTSIQVPTSGKAIYKQIMDVDLDSADLKELTMLINSIKRSAFDASNKDHDDRSENTRELLNILKKNYKNPIDLLEKLESLHKELLASKTGVTKGRARTLSSVED